METRLKSRGNTEERRRNAIEERAANAGIAPNASEAVGATDRRKQVLEVAYDLIANRGFEGLRFAEVAAQAGINPATLAYYFPSKEMLIRSVAKSLVERLQAPQEGIDQARHSNALVELRQIFAGMRSRVTADPSLVVVITELALRAKRDPTIARIGEERDRSWVRRVTGILERGAADGVFRNDVNHETAAAALIVQIKGIVHYAAMGERTLWEMEALIATLAAQVELWLTNSPSNSR